MRPRVRLWLRSRNQFGPRVELWEMGYRGTLDVGLENPRDGAGIHFRDG